MSDLIERLRAHQSGHSHGSCQDCYANIMDDAADEIEKLRIALDKSVQLQSHYASILNAYDGGARLQFRNGDEWIARLGGLTTPQPRA
jgi:hypothetical protein